MTTQHVYNLDLDAIAENGNSIEVPQKTLDVFASFAKEFSSLNEGLAKSMQSSLITNFSEIAKRAIMPSESLLETIKSAMDPTVKLRQQMVESFKSFSIESIAPFASPILDVPELDYDEMYENPVILDIDLNHRVNAPEMSAALVKLPKNTKWEDLRFVLVSDRVLIVYCRGKRIGQFTCEELGMARMSTSDKQPDKRFQFLYHMAIILQNKHTGVWPTTNVLATRDITKVATKKQLNLVHTTKKLLSKQLIETFGIDNEPILYDPKYGYQPKFSLEFISEIQVGLHEELADKNMGVVPEDLKDYLEPPIE